MIKITRFKLKGLYLDMILPLDYRIEFSFTARRSWLDARLFEDKPLGYYKHFVWGKISLIFGRPHLVPIEVCADCNETIEVLNAGDEYWNFCEGCRQTEGETKIITTAEYEAIHG